MSKKRILSSFHTSLLILALLPSAYFQVNCQPSHNVKTMHINNKICNYSFECSGNYDKDGPYADDNGEIPFATLDLLSPKRLTKPGTMNIIPGKENTTGSIEYRPASIKFLIFGKAIVRKASDNLESFLSKWKNDITILERTKTIIAGIEADQIIYEDTAFLMGIPRWHREIYFDYKDLNWELTAFCDKDLQEVINADFDHIVRTFKIQ